MLLFIISIIIFAQFNTLASINFEISSATIGESSGGVSLNLKNIGSVNGTVGYVC